MTDTQTFEEFYEATRHRVVTFVYAVTGDLGDAQDIAQEAYARAWQRWATIALYGDPEAWVRQVGYRLAINRWRKARNGIKAYLRLGPAAPADPPSADAIAVREALRLLPADQRLVLTMHHLLDLPITEIAQQTGIPANTIKTRLARGRRRLAQLIGKDISEEAASA